MQSALRSCSPLHLVEKMPDISYTIFHCANDKAVNLEKHSSRFVEAMEATHTIRLNIVPWRGHCDLSAAARVDYNQSILKAFE
jgi:hypothetical protein